MPKIKCPYHEDSTASMEVYGDGFAHCFGCGITVEHEKLGYTGPLREKYVENLEEKFAYINGLPKKEIRGVLLPYDSVSYFIVWPDGSYYNQRYFDLTNGKYKLPSGHQKRLFWAKRQDYRDTLIIVEGEINALSIALVCPTHCSVVCPGGAGDFYSRTSDKYLDTYMDYARVILVADKDSAGAIAVIQLKSNLLALGARNVTIHLMEVDANDILVKHGTEKLKDEIKKAMEVPQRMQDTKGALSTSGSGTSKHESGK